MKKTTTTKKTLKLFWYHAWKHHFYVIGILISLPLAILAESYLNVIILANVLAKLAKGGLSSHYIWHDFGASILGYAGLMLIGSIAWRVVDGFNWRLEASVERDIAERIYDHMLDQSANFHANRFGGSLVSQTNKLTSSYIRFADTTIYQVLQLIASLIFTAIILAPRAPQFVIVLLLFSVLYMGSGSFVTKDVRRLSSKLASSESRQTGYLADSIANIMAIKSFAGTHFERSRFRRLTNISRENTLELMRSSQKQMAYFSILNRVILVMALVLAIFGVVVFKANIATVFLIFSYTGSLVSQLWIFCNNSLKNYNRAFGDASDMTEILELEPEIKDPKKPEKSQINGGTIVFKKVKFVHSGVNEPLFENFDLKIKSGEKVGLVGRSGSGKTTLTRLILRFSDIDSGEILIDGQNITSITQDDLHSSIAYVPQDPIMFHRSLMDNIRYGDFDASDEVVYGSAKLAHADEFIKDQPKGYDTLVGERGVKLSGGQRQRIAIARALLKNAPILLLDEATSALDSESEALIQDALWKLMERRTAIIIAHRLSTIQKMDRIIVLDDGKVTEQGTHKELIRQNGIYAQLWQRQSGGFIEE